MSFARDGYEVWTLNEEAVAWVHDAQCELEVALAGPLDEYGEDDVHRHAQAAAVVQEIPRLVITEHIEEFRELLGGDIHIQRRPFLRISRPHAETDNIGFHRDTWYGDTPFEISVWIPFTDTQAENALQVAPASHLWSEVAYPTERFPRPDVAKGSVKHSLGFIYDPPKRLERPVPMTPLPVKVGQMIVFSLALLHGVEVNRSSRTRVSMDVRLANSLAPVKFQRARDDNYYEPLCTSPVTEAARRYYEAQG